MRTINLLIILFCFIFDVKSQIKLGQYRWLITYNMQQCDIAGTPTTPLTSILSVKGQIFEIVAFTPAATGIISDQTTTHAIIKILDYKNRDDPSSKFYIYNYNGGYLSYFALNSAAKNAKSYANNQKYFLIPISIFTTSGVEQHELIASNFEVGILNFPAKFRFNKKNTDFSGPFNLGATIDLTLRHFSSKKSKTAFVFGIGISNNNLDTASVRRNQSILSSANNFSTFTICYGVMKKFGRLQIGLFSGNDWINNLNQITFGWKYQGKFWASLAFGYSIFTPTERPSNNIPSN